MNASPFDSELIDKDGFNAVLYREIIENKSKVKFKGKYFRLLYNPVIDHISENNKQYGSFYRSDGIDSLYWYCFDQVLITRELVPNFKVMEYCRSTGGKFLISKTCPNSKISDHLPLIVKFERSFR